MRQWCYEKATYQTRVAGCGCGARGHVLALTALVFLLPAWRLPEGSALRRAVALLVLTSLAYHGTHAPAARLVDVMAVRLVVCLALASRAHRTHPLGLLAFAGVLAIHLLPLTHVRLHGPLHTHAHAAMHCLGAAGVLCAAA